jgi:hypothetical protein
MASAAVKERLRKLRQKFHLGEYRKSKSARPRRAKRARVVHARRSVVRMARRRGRKVSHRRGVMGMGGMGSIAKSALVGVGAAHFAGYIPVSIPFKEEAAGAIGAYLVAGKSVKSAAIGGIAVYLAKMLSGSGAASSGNAYGF